MTCIASEQPLPRIATAFAGKRNTLNRAATSAAAIQLKKYD
jgi:hypothetical protein